MITRGRYVVGGVPIELTPEEFRAAVTAARYDLARQDFVEFLAYVMIEEVIVRAGEAYHGGAIPFERWPHLVERARAWGSGQSEVILKARQLGLSWLAAAYALFVAQRKGARVLLLSKGEMEAFELLAKARFIWDHLPEGMRLPLEVDNDGELTFKAGGTIRALPSTKNAGRGFTATLVIGDESAFHVWAAENYKAYRPAVGDGGQLLLLSTANGVGGFFYDQWQVALRRGGEPEPGAVRAVFIPWNARPDRDAAWLARERAAFEGMPDEFRQEYPGTAAEAFVQLTGLVYPMFDAAIHVLDAPPVPWEGCLYRYIGYDLGGGDPTAIVAAGVYRDSYAMPRVHVYSSFYKRLGAPTVLEMFEWMANWDRPDAPVTWVEADPKDAVVEQSLAALGLRTRTADWSRGKGLGVVAQYLEQGWLTIDQSCYEGIAEFASYRWATRVDVNSKDRYATGTPFDHHGDFLDSVRYALMGIYRDLLNERGATVAYSEVIL